MKLIPQTKEFSIECFYSTLNRLKESKTKKDQGIPNYDISEYGLGMLRVYEYVLPLIVELEEYRNRSKKKWYQFWK